MMATYNSEMNRRLYAAAGRLMDEERRAPRGAFFGSIHGTLNHLLWADQMWMSRFDGWDKPVQSIAESPEMVGDFPTMLATRINIDGRMEAWARRVTPAALEGETLWFSGSAQRDVAKPTALVITHLFNHQTHHRGQVHALLTAAGEVTGDTDLWLLVP
ncbi:putative damage-inducible protein DinB [Humitalea rosea]|uniref:Putative damage-inducible protein DinB n=1 Tax=Humitalea rosea TaxID=990373 RepID=A0A2W7JSU5_9PROT|nr:DinB family protein [Humitalea rosea]PZW38530.1 putative damage-inducible protein DinB [Humitalea rosea]